MVIKTTILHSGWSYGNGDDHYNNDSIGSTRTVNNLEKLMENSSRNKKNEPVEIMCSRIKKEKHTQHSDEHGWTKINANSSHKPKRKNSQEHLIQKI
jgi:hypothetical protein